MSGFKLNCGSPELHERKEDRRRYEEENKKRFHTMTKQMELLERLISDRPEKKATITSHKYLATILMLMGLRHQSNPPHGSHSRTTTIHVCVCITFHMSRSCSSTVAPGNIGRPHAISKNMQPTPLQNTERKCIRYAQ